MSRLRAQPSSGALGLPVELELAPACCSADEGETQKVEGLRFAEPTLLAVGRRMATKLDQAGLVRMKRQRKLLQPRTHLIQEAPGVGLMLKADDEVVGVPHDDHVARGFTPSPACGPEIEYVVQVDVGQ